MKIRRKLVVLPALLLVVGIVCGCGLWLQAQRRQYALSRRLIVALKRFDTAQALALVRAGADPNTRSTAVPPPSLLQLWRQLLHRTPFPANDSATALAIACGGFWQDGYMSFLEDEGGHDDAALVQAMLDHGADVNAKQEGGWTPLIAAATSVRPGTVRLLLEHGAHPNAYDASGRTALIWAASRVYTPGCSQIITLLLDHNADTNVEDESGETALMLAISSGYTDLVRQLLAHGADANHVNRYKMKYLPFAQALHHAEIIALLKRAGAKEDATQ